MIDIDGEWDATHELAALKRLFEIGRQMIEFGVAEMSTARNLACCSTSTEREFALALRQIARMTPEQVRIEVARVYRVVAERGQP